MDAEARPNKRIEIAARFISGLTTCDGVAGEIRTNKELYARFALDVADAIIDTAIGDMTVEMVEE